jgi:hypothetical protein
VTSFLAGPFQVQRVVDVVVGQDPLLGDTPRRPSTCTTCGALLLERGTQKLGLPTLLIEPGLEILSCASCACRAAEPTDAAGFAAGTTAWFAGGGSSLFPSSLGASSIAPSASSTMMHSRVGS